jgi:peptidoglycan/xylan/chitin deacetylase (PgdA/CDA1 family)
MTRVIRCFCIAAVLWSLETAGGRAAPASTAPAGDGRVAILVYHRFESAVADSMAVRTAKFASELRYLADHQYRIVPLRTIVSALQRKEPLPAHAVAITVDDGHRTVYTDMLPLVRQYKIPVTLFIYPSAISNASYAMTWAQLEDLRRTGFFDVQSHTYWHPNFKIERRRLAPAAFDGFVTSQLVKPKMVLKAKLGVDADMLAWPFGIYDDDLIARAKAAGYVAAFTLRGRLVAPGDPLLALPRFLITDAVSDTRFASILPPADR